MKIIRLETENIKNIKVVEIKPKDDAIILTGKNGAGKSAILDSVFMALTGNKMEEPIRIGEKRAQIVVDLGRYIVKRVYTEKTNRVEVTSKDGEKFLKPQELLNNILGKLSFDPLSFMSMKELEQRKFLIDIIGLDVSKFDKKREEKFNERTIESRKVKELQAQLATFTGEVCDETKEISMSDELKKVEILERKREEYILTVNFLRDTKTEHENLKIQINSLTEKLASCKRTYSENRDKLPAKVTKEEIIQAKTKMLSIELINTRIREGNKHRAEKLQLATAIETVQNLSIEITKNDLDKVEAIKNCKFPLAKLCVTDKYVTYADKPISQLSTGEKIRVSTAIAMKLNPKLKIIFIKDGSLLDDDSLKAIISMASKNDYQLWIEKVCDGPNKGVGIYIENGEITERQV